MNRENHSPQNCYNLFKKYSSLKGLLLQLDLTADTFLEKSQIVLMLFTEINKTSFHEDINYLNKHKILTKVENITITVKTHLLPLKIRY